MKIVKFFTLGCKVNMYETESMRGLFEKNGYISTNDDSADVFVINTCTVTSVGDKKSRQMIRRAKRNNPNSIVAVVGCYSQVSPDEVRKLDDVDIILGTTDRKRIVEYVENYAGFRIDAVKNVISSDYEDLQSVQQSRTRATIKIQDGCTNFCSYCIIPYARGSVRSRLIDSAVNEVTKLTAEGFTEVVLVGIHLASYGRDLDLKLIDIIKEICKVEGLKRVRLGSLEPNLLTQEFVDEIEKLPKLCHSFHISMQSGCTETLKRMNRKYTAEQYLETLDRVRQAMPDSSITTDVMVGFPQETDEEFDENYNTVKKAQFSDIHVFPYSRRNGTPAAIMDGQVDEKVKSQRSHKMIELGHILKKDYCEKYIGKELEVLFEQCVKDNIFEGLTENYIRVFANGEDLAGEYRTVRLTKFCGDYCEGEIIGE